MSSLKFFDGLGNRFLINELCLRLILNTLGLPHLGTRIRIKILSKTLGVINYNKFAKFLDAGCGYGFISLYLAKQKLNVTGIDKNIQRLTVAKKLTKISNLKINYLRAKLDNLPFNNSQFDVCICFEVLEHLKNDLEALKELSRVVRKNGHIIISVPQKNANTYGFEKFNHVRTGYTKLELNLLAEKVKCKVKYIFPYGKSILGKAALNTNFIFSRFFPILSILSFPIFYPLLLVDQYLKDDGEPTAYVVVFIKKGLQRHTIF